MCDYCDGNRDIAHGYIDGEHKIAVNIWGDSIVGMLLDANGDSIGNVRSEPISHCPMCGKQLR